MREASDSAPSASMRAIRWWSGAPALVVWWFAAIWAGTVACGGRLRFEERYRGGSVLWLVVGVLGAILLTTHLLLFVRDRRDAGRHAQNGPQDTHDEARGLRLLSGSASVVGALVVLSTWLRWASGAYGPAALYGDAGEILGRPPGVSVAVVLAAFGGLYVSESLPLSPWDVRHGPSAKRLFRVLAMLTGLGLFILTLNVISHFSVGRALLYIPH